jgi:hypothetical protein
MPGGVWDDAELLHHRHHVDDFPVLVRETVAAEPNDVDELHVDALAGRAHAHQLPLVAAVDRRLGRRLSLYASSSHGEVVTPPHQKETQPARRDVIALTTGKQRTRGAGWLLSFVHSGHVVRARSRYCSYWRPTAEIKIGRGRHRVALKVSRDLAIDRALVSPGFVAMRVWPWCRGPVCSDKAGTEPRRWDAGGGVRDVEADGESVTLHGGHGAKPGAAWTSLTDRRCGSRWRAALTPRQVIIVPSREVAAEHRR